MRRRRWVGLLLAGLAMAGGAAKAGADVRAHDPGHWSDADNAGSGRSAEAVAAALVRHLHGLAAAGLRPGQDLSVELLDVDLAGQAAIGTGSNWGLRVVTERTPPRIRLRWSFTERRRIVSAGEETLSDPFFTWNPAARASGDPLGYEKELLTAWFRRRIAGPRSPA